MKRYKVEMQREGSVNPNSPFSGKTRTIWKVKTGSVF